MKGTHFYSPTRSPSRTHRARKCLLPYAITITLALHALPQSPAIIPFQVTKSTSSMTIAFVLPYSSIYRTLFNPPPSILVVDYLARCAVHYHFLFLSFFLLFCLIEANIILCQQTLHFISSSLGIIFSLVASLFPNHINRFVHTEKRRE
jgi:hypothetical protein